MLFEVPRFTALHTVRGEYNEGSAELLNNPRQPGDSCDLLFALRRVREISRDVAGTQRHAILVDHGPQQPALVPVLDDFGEGFERPEALRPNVLEGGLQCHVITGARE